MEVWVLLFTIFVATVSFLLLVGLPLKKKKGEENRHPLPPGPKPLPFIGNIHQIGLRFSHLEAVFRRYHAEYGPVFRVFFGGHPAVFVATRDLAHQALVQGAGTFAGRPPATEISRIINSNQHNISSADYGPLWRLFRRNLMAETLSPARTKSFSDGRRWVLSVLVAGLKTEADRNDRVVTPIPTFQRAMFCLLLYMCFGQKLDDDAVKKVETALRNLILSFGRFNVLGIFPKLSKIFLQQKWRQLMELRRNQVEAILPLILARKAVDGTDQSARFCYADSLLSLELPGGGRKLNDGELVSLCSEFLNGGTDTTSTALQWVMANLVKHPHVQNKLHEEIVSHVSTSAWGGGSLQEISEDVAGEIPYLKAVILETLRRHPPGHFALPHAVTLEEDATLGGFKIPKNATLNFMVAHIGVDEKVWKDPLEFRPERFLPGGEGEDVDITGSREIKMMPFGAGRRICPGMGVAMLHLQYYVANLVREFEWLEVEGQEVDLAEKVEFTVVMQNPLVARVLPRRTPDEIPNY